MELHPTPIRRPRNQARPVKSGVLLDFFALSNCCLRLFSLVSDVDTPCLIRRPSGHPSRTSWTPFSGTTVARDGLKSPLGGPSWGFARHARQGWTGLMNHGDS